jgi:VIT1/CCC1 family predicted Fe2+/Mn2+ transporter
LTARDGAKPVAVCLLVFMSTFPVAVPFLLVSDTRLALRFSNAIAVAMLFLCGFALGRRIGLSPWTVGGSMVGVGVALVGVAIVLGG